MFRKSVANKVKESLRPNNPLQDVSPGIPANQLAPRRLESSNHSSPQSMHLSDSTVAAANFQSSIPQETPTPRRPLVSASNPQQPKMAIPMPINSYPTSGPQSSGSAPTVPYPVETNANFGPKITGMRLNQPQKTAAEYALEFNAKINELKARNRTLATENQHLAGKLRTTQSKLEDAASAMQVARSELSSSLEAFEALRSQILELERLREQDRQRSEQTLLTIQKELDQVLMNEMIQ